MYKHISDYLEGRGFKSSIGKRFKHLINSKNTYKKK